jgi:pimeloyl-ACP methyl ester carboxylesterase
MTAATESVTGLAYDDEGAGPAVVFLHGLTFDRRSWAPIIERLDGCVRSIAIDLPAHGDSGGAPTSLDEVVAQVHQLAGSLAVDRPILVGHSMSGGLASLYASARPSRGVVSIDNGPDIRPFAQLVQQLEPALCGPGFTQVWQSFEDSLGLQRLPKPMRSLVLATHQVIQDVVVGYWQTVLHTDPDELQALIDAQLHQLEVPYLGVFGRPITPSERERFGWLPDAQLEEWAGDGPLRPPRRSRSLRHPAPPVRRPLHRHRLNPRASPSPTPGPIDRSVGPRRLHGYRRRGARRRRWGRHRRFDGRIVLRRRRDR